MSQEFRQMLKEELASRCKRNPKYSLRAFAHALTMDPSTLAKVLNGKRPLGRRSVERLSGKLGLRPADAAKDPYAQLTADAFEVIADWQHYALLELMTIASFKPDVAWAARRLKISPAEVRAALDRLVRVGMLEITAEGAWNDRSGGKSSAMPAASGTAAVSGAFKQHQRQVLELALAALDDTPLEDRDQTSMTLAIDRRKLGEARALIKQFRRDLAALLCRTGTRSDVYHLSVSLYPVSRSDPHGVSDASP